MTATTSTGVLSALLMCIIAGHAVPFQPQYSGPWHWPRGPSQSSHGAWNFTHSVHHSFNGGHQFSHVASSTSSHIASSTSMLVTTTSSAGGLNPNAMNCQVVLPSNALTAAGLSTPWKLLPPCSQAVTGQQAFAEAAVIDSNGQISIYHPLIIDQGKTPQAAPVVPNLGSGSQVALFFGFNGGVLTLVDSNGADSNTSPVLQNLNCVNGLPGVQGDVFGQVSWCNTQPFWDAANAAVMRGQLQVPPLGTDNIGKLCPSTRSFEIIDQDQSDNLPTKYLLLGDGSTVQFTAANQAKFGTATEIDNASDEALIADFVDPVIGCTPYQVNSLDDPGAQVSSLATQELQALIYQQEPIALIPLNNPDALLTASQSQSPSKTNAYRIGVNQPQLGTGSNTDDGSPTNYCNNMVNIQPPFLKAFQNQFTNAMTPDAGIGNNLFTFLANRFLQSLTNLACQNQNIPVQCTLDGNGAATACTIFSSNNTGSSSASMAHSSARATSSNVASFSQSSQHSVPQSSQHSAVQHSQRSAAPSSQRSAAPSSQHSAAPSSQHSAAPSSRQSASVPVASNGQSGGFPAPSSQPSGGAPSSAIQSSQPSQSIPAVSSGPSGGAPVPSSAPSSAPNGFGGGAAPSSTSSFHGFSSASAPQQSGGYWNSGGNWRSGG